MEKKNFEDIGLLLLRLGAGGTLFLAHGWGKFGSLFSDSIVAFQPDPLGIGKTPTLILMIFAEFVCALFIAAGFLTRAASLVLVINMAVAAFIQHFSDPFKVKELAFVYLVMFLAIFFLGAGKYSLAKMLSSQSGLIKKLENF